MHLHENHVCQTKEEFVVNILAMGVATQLVAGRYGRTLQEWSEYITEAAEDQLSKLSPSQIEQMIDMYVKISQEI